MSFPSIIFHFMITYTTETSTSVSYRDSLLYVTNVTLSTKLYDKHDDFDFRIVNFPFICSNIPEPPAYGVYISQLIRYTRSCSSYSGFIDRGRLLTKKLVGQGCTLEQLKIYFRKLNGWYNYLLQHITILPFYNFYVTQSSPDMTSYTLDSMAGACTPPRHLFTHLGFPECPSCLEYNMCSRLCHDCLLWTEWLCLINGWRTVVSLSIQWPSHLLMCVGCGVFDLAGCDWLCSWFHVGCVATAGEVYSS